MMTTSKPLLEAYFCPSINSLNDLSSDSIFCLHVNMPRQKKVQSVEPVNVEPVDEKCCVSQPTPLTKDDYLKARATIKQWRETKKAKPKRQCTEKQLAALAAGRARNQRFKNQVKPSD